MFGIADYGAYVIAMITFLMIPGPGNLAIATSAVKGGFWGGMAATVGIVAGDQMLIWAAVAGVAALLKASPLLFVGVQWLGAVYLIWLGWRMWRVVPGDAPMLKIQPGRYFQQTVLITLLNPKAIVFYMAFFPLFIDPHGHQGWLTFVMLAVTAALLGLVYGLIATLLVRVLADRVRASPRVARCLNRVAGTLLIGFGLKLALSR